MTHKPATPWRIQLMEADRMAYDVFNRFNDEKRFEIRCSVEAATGSHFTRQVCQPEFEIRATREHAQGYHDSMPGPGRLPSGSFAPTGPVMEVEILRQQSAYRLKMRRVAEEHPEFLEAIKRYAELQEKYEGRLGE